MNNRRIITTVALCAAFAGTVMSQERPERPRRPNVERAVQEQSREEIQAQIQELREKLRAMDPERTERGRPGAARPQRGARQQGAGVRNALPPELRARLRQRFEAMRERRGGMQQRLPLRGARAEGLRAGRGQAGRAPVLRDLIRQRIRDRVGEGMGEGAPRAGRGAAVRGPRGAVDPRRRGGRRN